MQFGWSHAFRRQSDADGLAEGIDHVVQAEEWGLDSIWLVDIHQQSARSVLTALLTVPSATAARTSRPKLGTGVRGQPFPRR